MNWSLLANSLLVAGSATALAMLLGAAVALTITAASSRWRMILIALSIAVLALPSFLVTNCWIDLLGSAGKWRSAIPFDIFSLPGTVWILALLLWPVPALAMHAAWRKLEPAFIEADAALRGPMLFRLLLWPAAKSLAGVAAAVVFALALSNFAVPAILQVKVYPAEMWVQFNTHLNAWRALQLSWPMLLVAFTLLLALRRADFSWPRETQQDFASALRKQLGALRAISLLVTALVLAVALVTPLLQLLVSPRTWRELAPAFRAGMPALSNSVVYAVSAALIVAILSLLLVHRRFVAVFWLAFLLPGVLLGIGAISAFNHPGFDWLTRTALLVIVLLVVRYLALARSMNRVALQSTDTLLVDNARLDGAKQFQLLRSIVLPQILPQFCAAVYFVYVLCLWDVETTLLVVPPGGETLALRVFNLLHYGHNAHVNALCLLLLLLALAPLLLFALVVGGRRFRRSAQLLALTVPIVGSTGCNPASDSSKVSLTPVRSDIFSHVQVIGRRGTGAGEFNKPRSLTTDTNGNLYVVDMTGRVQKFSPAGEFLLSWQMPETDLGKAKGMSCDRDGNIVIVEPHYQRVNHFTPDGRLVAQWGRRGTNAGELTLPRAVAIDRKNNVIVSEYTLVDRVQKFSARGERSLAAWGAPGLGPAQFNRAESVCVDAQDNIYVADSCNHRIQVFSPEGKFLREHGRAGEDVGELSYPYDIQVDEQGRQYVCEFGNSRIQVFDRDNRSLEIIGESGSLPGEFANPWSIALDREGNLYVADSQNHRVQKLIRKKTPHSRLQTSTNLQRPNFQNGGGTRGSASSWSLDVWWSLEFGIWRFLSQ